MQTNSASACMHGLRRHFSTSSSLQQLVKAPLQLFGVDGKYASALYSAATKQKELPTVEKEIAAFTELLAKDTKLREFVRDPTYNRPLKVAALQQVATKLNYSSVTKNFLGIVAENGRMSKLESIMKAFGTLMSAHRGEVVCQVVTAKALDSGMKTQVETALKAFAKSGEKIQINYVTEPAIIGGMKVTIGDKFVDMSIASKIQMYQKVVEDAIV